MMDDLAKWLQAMLNCGSISSFVSVQIPAKTLKTGWIGQGLIQKGFSGKLEDKRNQEQLVIPLDRFVRLTNEWIDEMTPNLGLFLLGKRGLMKQKFVAIVSNEAKKKETESVAIAFQSDGLGLLDTIHQLTQFFSGEKPTHTVEEPNLDYLEELKSQTSGGFGTHLLAIRIPSSSEKIDELIQVAKKDDIDLTSIIAKYGDVNEISSIASLVVKWLLGLNLFQRTRDNMAALTFILNSKAWLCLWDSSQNIVTFTGIDQSDFEKIMMKYIYPLWFTSDDLVSKSSKGPSVILGKGKTHSTASKSSIKTEELAKSYRAYESKDILEGLVRRMRIIEDQLSSIEMATKENEDDNAISVVSSRLTETVDKLESLVTKLNMLEKRIEKVSKETS